MNPLLTLTLFIANLLALSVTLGVLFLAYSRHPGEGYAITQFLIAVAFYNLTVMITMIILTLDLTVDLQIIATNLSISGFMLTVVAAFSLIVSLAGMMKQAYQVIGRAGFVIFVLLLWPLWTGKFFMPDSAYYLASNFAPAGLVASAIGLVYIVLTLGTIWHYRQHLEPTIALGVMFLLAAQVLAILNPTVRKFDLASLVAAIASAILGYRLARRQLFNPLMVQNTQLAALSDVAHTVTGTGDLQGVLDVVVRQARRMLNADMTVLILHEAHITQPFVVSAQDGGSKNLVGQRFESGAGISEHIFETKKSMRLQNYRMWENQSPVFGDIQIAAIIGVPLLYADNILGVLIASELKAGRTFTDRDEAMLEMLAPQAAVAIMNAQLRQRVAGSPGPQPA